jgi:uncharacterized protein (TIGR02145 family)
MFNNKDMRNKNVILLILTMFCSEALQAQIVKDADNNIYSIVRIGNQIWMAENLKTSKLNDGKKIPLVTDNAKWKALETPAYCWFENDSTNEVDYGALYNWFTVNTKKLCPAGWHVPSDDEWGIMISTLGDVNTRGDRLKEAGVEHWKSTQNVGNNETGFTALPSGMRYDVGTFPLYGRNYTVWWSSTGSDNFAWNRGLFNSSSKTFRGHESMRSGFSVRCIKD